MILNMLVHVQRQIQVLLCKLNIIFYNVHALMYTISYDINIYSRILKTLQNYIEIPQT